MYKHKVNISMDFGVRTGVDTFRATEFLMSMGVPAKPINNWAKTLHAYFPASLAEKILNMKLERTSMGVYIFPASIAKSSLPELFDDEIPEPLHTYFDWIMIWHPKHTCERCKS